MDYEVKDYEVIREKAKCPHSNNGFLCPKCRYNPTRFLKKWEDINTERL